MFLIVMICEGNISFLSITKEKGSVFLRFQWKRKQSLLSCMCERMKTITNYDMPWKV